MLRDDTKLQAPLQRCTIPGCGAFETGAKETCVTWGHRLCYPHFAAFVLWSEGRLDGWTTDTTKAFVAWVDGKKHETEAA